MSSKKRVPVIDGHVHLFSDIDIAKKIKASFNEKFFIPDGYCGEGIAEDLLLQMKKNKVDYSVVANFSTPKYIDSNNRFTLSLGEDFKSLVPLISVHPEMTGLDSKLLDEYISMGAKGLKLHPMAQEFDPVDKKMMPVYEWCSENLFPIVFHCGRVANARRNEFSDLEIIVKVIKKFPKANFVVTHMADGSYEDIRKTASTFGHVFYDTSIVLTGNPVFLRFNEPSWQDDDRFVSLVKEFGSERFIFGTDYPWGNQTYDISRFRKMNLSDADKNNILGGNAARLFRIS